MLIVLAFMIYFFVLGSVLSVLHAQTHLISAHSPET